MKMCGFSRRFLHVIALSLLVPGLSFGHSPHHVITDIAASTGDDSGSDIFILITDQIFKSDQDGRSWKNIVTGLTNQYVFTSIGLSSSYATDRTAFVATAGDGIYQSVDGGQSWQAVNSGLEKLDIARLSVSRQFDTDRRVLAASASGGVWRRSNDEDRWQLVLTERVRITGFAEFSVEGEDVMVFAGDAAGNIWRSDDSGRLWEIVHELPGKQAITSIAADQNNIFVGTQQSGLYRSRDAGETFAAVNGFRSVRNRDCLGTELDRPVPDMHITSVTMSPESVNTSRVFVTTWYNGVLVSDDDGQTWSQWNDGLTCDVQADDMSQAHFRSVAIDTTDNGDIVYWLGAFDGLFRGVGNSPTWQQMETLPLGLIKGMAVTGGSDDLTIALATYGGGFYLTIDRGLTWTIGNKGLQTTRLTGLAFSSDYDRDGVIYAGASRRLLRSSDRGQSWQRIDLRITSFGQRVRNKLRRWGLPTAWLGSQDSSQVYPTMLASPPDDDDKIWFATRFHGVMGYEHSTTSVVSLWSETGKIMNSLEMSPDYENDRTLFASIRGEGAIRSDDGGNNWVAINTGLDFVDQWIADPAGGNLRRDVIFAISPDFASDKSVFAGSPANDGLFVSRDRGNTWVRLSFGSGSESAPILVIALSPDFAIDRTMMVSIKGLGIYRSVDGGLTFAPAGTVLQMANASIEHLFFSQAFTTDYSVVAASDEQLFISEDAGDSWAAISRPVRYEDMRDVVEFAGNVERRQSENYSALTEAVISGLGSSARLHFVGSGIRWLGSRGDQCGNANVYIDGSFYETVSCRAGESKNMQTLFETDGLTYGAHEVEVRIESDLADNAVGIDAFDVLQTLNRKL